MEHYAKIQRRDGTLFFAVVDDRDVIAASIERLIDLLDAYEGDPDLEPYLAGYEGGTDDREDDYADDEPSLAAAERHPAPSGFTYGDAAGNHTQERWAAGVFDDREDDGDDLEPDVDAEHSNGWTGHIDQTTALFGNCNMDGGEGEPDLGFVGIATGWREGEDTQDREACQLGGSELEWDFAESGVADFEALQDIDHCSFLTAAQAGLIFDGSGIAKGEELILRAKSRTEPYSRIIGTRNHLLQDGSVFMTLIPR